MEEVFDAIDEWYRGNSHMGQERTWTYCRDKYFNITQNLVKHTSMTGRLVLSVAKRIQLQSLQREEKSPSNQRPSEKGFSLISLIFAS
jgi:hypothetical protein